MTTLHTVSFQKTVLASLIGLCLSQSAFALQEISDDSLSETTGEGIALLPQDFSFRLNGADTANSGQGTYGTGYIRLIPVGPLSTTQESKGYQKSDVYLYGLSLAQSKRGYADTSTGRTSTDWGVPFGAIGTGAADFGQKITSWGTFDNPWVIKTLTNPDVPDFTGAINGVTYLTLEAPLYKTGTIASTDADYNLKLGFWADAFMRDKTLADSGTYNTNELKNRLRLGFVWDGFSINGSNVKIFQTLGGVAANGPTYNATLQVPNPAFNYNIAPNTTTNRLYIDQAYTFNSGLNTSYNKTFGMAGLLRLNSVPTDTAERRGVVSAQTVTREIRSIVYDPTYVDPVTNIKGRFSEGAVLQTVTGGNMTVANANAANNQTDLRTSYDPPTNATVSGSFPNGGMCGSPKPNTASNASSSVQVGQCYNQNGFTTRRFKAYGNNTWTPPKTKSVIRISTQELVGGSYDNSTPALGGTVPNFSANNYTAPNDRADGIFLYDPNINLVLGNFYQPLMFSTDGNNFSIELARVPNVPEVYRRIYTRYLTIDPLTDIKDSSGKVLVAKSADTTTTYSGSTCNIYQCGTASGGYQGNTATHSSITIGSTVRADTKTIGTTTLNNLNYLEAYQGVEAYGVSIGELKTGTNLSSSKQEDFTQVWQRSRTGTCTWVIAWVCQNWSSWPTNWTAVAPKAAITGQAHPSLNRPDPYETTWRQNYNNQILGIQTTMPSDMAGKINSMSPPGATVSNNFGSAVIDGLLIQHFKFSTTGL